MTNVTKLIFGMHTFDIESSLSFDFVGDSSFLK